MSKIESLLRALTSEVDAARKLYWHFTCDPHFKHSLGLPFAAVLSVSKGLTIHVL